MNEWRNRRTEGERGIDGETEIEGERIPEEMAGWVNGQIEGGTEALGKRTIIGGLEG